LLDSLLQEIENAEETTFSNSPRKNTE